MLEYQLMRDFRYRLSGKPEQTFLSRAWEGFSRLIEKILLILKSPKGNRIPKQKIKPQRIKPPERLPPPRKIQPKVLMPDGKIKSHKGSPFGKLNRFR